MINYLRKLLFRKAEREVLVALAAATVQQLQPGMVSIINVPAANSQQIRVFQEALKQKIDAAYIERTGIVVTNAYDQISIIGGAER